MNGKPLETLTFEEFQKVEIRVGTIVEVQEFPERASIQSVRTIKTVSNSW